jgi:hypothetical protein
MKSTVQVLLIEQITRNFKDAGTIASMTGHFEGKIGQKQENKPRQHKRSEKN